MSQTETDKALAASRCSWGLQLSEGFRLLVGYRRRKVEPVYQNHSAMHEWDNRYHIYYDCGRRERIQEICVCLKERPTKLYDRCTTTVYSNGCPRGWRR